ncbi:MAG: hypothetical protein AB8B69_15900, partial [Chitinophagales bacterium]
NNDETDRPFFGGAEEIEGTPKVLEKLYKDHDNKIDEPFAARSRLFDLFINDWDRHDDQWRWAEMESEKGKTYRPIPRDRDQVFYKFDGVLPSMSNRKWGMRKFQKFDHEIRDVAGLAFNGRHFDRSFITRLDKKEWMEIAKELQEALTDEVIEAAIRDMPEEVFAIDGEDIISKLKSRRERLVNTAERLYTDLAKTVTVVGSNDKEEFEINVLNDNDVEVAVNKLSSKKGKDKGVYYHRIFHSDETKELQLYGLGDDDIFNLKGSGNNAIRIRIIGGKGEDEFNDTSTGGGKKAKVYDTKEGNKLNLGNNMVNKTTNDTIFNQYDRKEFQYNVAAPAVFIGFNPDDGIFLGGGITYVKHGFKKNPYASKHYLAANASLGADAFNFRYNGDFTHAIGKWNLNLDLDVKYPNAIYNFYGLDNESTRLSDDQILIGDEDNYNRVRLQQLNFYASLRQSWNEGRQSISFGPHYQTTDVEDTEGRFVSHPASGLGASDFEPSQYVGAKLNYQYARVNNINMPLQGGIFNLNMSYNTRIDNNTNEDKSFLRLGGELKGYVPLSKKAVFAVRVGGAHNFGDFEFFQSNTLGNIDNFRGIRRFRYAGKTNFYQNTDLRIKLFDIKNYILPTSVGVVLFNDFGRVWVEDDTSDTMHHSYGGGVFFSPFGMAVVRATYGISKNDEVFTIGAGFLF